MALLREASREKKPAEGLGEKLGENQAAIVAAMGENPKVTVVELSRKLRISTTAVEKNIEPISKLIFCRHPA